MTCYLAPEKPRVFSTITEQFFNQTCFHSNRVSNSSSMSNTRFGREYENELCFLLAKDASINTDDEICLIADQPQWATIIEENFFLNKKIFFIDSHSSSDVIRTEFATHSFDQIILLNCLENIYRSSLSLIRSARRSLTSNGNLIVIHRDPQLNTLPLVDQINSSWSNISTNLPFRLIKHLQREEKRRIEFSFQVQTIRFLIDKSTWFNLLYHQTFYPLSLIDQDEIRCGLRQLNETKLKYQNSIIELHDQLSFFIIPKNDPSLRKFAGSFGYSRSPTHEIEILNDLRRPKPVKRNLFASSLGYDMKIKDEKS